MSELVNYNISTESLCTVIENSTENTKFKDNTRNHSPIEANDTNSEYNVYDSSVESDLNSLDSTQSTINAPNGSLSKGLEGNCDNILEKRNNLHVESSKVRSKLKKSVSFDPNDEKIRKFVTGDPIVDQKNPFKHSYSNGSLTKKKKTPPPVPTKRSTLSVRKTVTQQLREREREKEKEKERIKNEANNRKTNINGSTTLSSPEEYITTEEVLNQSKYVKTYIKNPDPFFVYDPAVLARIKFEELREVVDKKPLRKLKLTTQTRERLKDLKSKPQGDVPALKTKLPTFKKCSKPNYPNLSDIKIKVGTEPDDNFFNPAEVTKNAKKFDERVKKLHLSSDDDLDEIEEPLTKSESSDEITANQSNTNNYSKQSSDTEQNTEVNGISSDNIVEQPADGTFTSTIKSREFQEYLNKKGLTLIPKKIPNGAQALYTNGSLKPKTHISFKPPECIRISTDTMDSSRNAKKPSVFQRLLSNSIFASRRKTTPKETVPNPKPLYESNTIAKENGSVRNPSAIKRVVLERQSYHGRPRANNLLNASETAELRNQTERSRKSFAGGDDLSISISSALTNAEYDDGFEVKQPNNQIVVSALTSSELQMKPITKPPRRTLSRDRLGNLQQLRQTEQQSVNIRPNVERLVAQATEKKFYPLAKENAELPSDGSNFRRTLERQSLIPKRTTQGSDKRQVFGRTSSMDRNEILKRNAIRSGHDTKTKSANGTLKGPAINASKDDYRQQFSSQNGPKLTSTPIRNAGTNANGAETYDLNLDKKLIISTPKTQITPLNGIFVDPEEWERLRAMKERTDQELYYKVLQHQQQQQLQQQQMHIQQQQQQIQLQLQMQMQQRQNSENIYEHLQHSPNLIPHPSQYIPTQQHALTENSFSRGSPQRNTFSGVIRNRQAKIIDKRAFIPLNQPPSQQQPQVSQPISFNNNKTQESTTRSQSVLDGMTQEVRVGFRREYESDTETPVVLRRRPINNPEPRRIGGILTREEILQKVKEFCRKSLNKTPTNQPQMQAIYEKQSVSTDLSPVSYASVETHQRPGSRMYAAPQVPQRMQSLPQQFLPITHEMPNEESVNTPSPVYAHVIKRSSLQSNQSELYDSPQRPYLVRNEADAQAIYVGQQQPRESAFSPTQYIIVDNNKILPAQVLNYYPADIYTQPQYIRPHQLQSIPGTYGYITVRESMPQQLRPRLHDGRSTPLILDQSSQHASQIYWTPQHQRLQQHAGLLPIQISPRYTPKQPYPTPAPRFINQMKYAVDMNATPNANIPNQRQSSPMLASNSTTKEPAQQKKPLPATSAEYNIQSAYEWESGSEAGEVQRIMERQRNNGEFKASNFFKSFKAKVSRLVGHSKR